MNRKSLRPLYSNLTGEERFRLALRAAASGDHSEATHVAETCPKLEGTGMDPTFTDPIHASFRLASAFARTAGPLFGWLNLVEALETLLTGENGRKTLQPYSQFQVTWVLDTAAREASQRLRALVDAFEEVCSTRAELPGSVLVGAWTQESAIALHQAQCWIGELEADPEIQEEFRATLDQAWTLE